MAQTQYFCSELWWQCTHKIGISSSFTSVFTLNVIVIKNKQPVLLICSVTQCSKAYPVSYWLNNDHDKACSHSLCLFSVSLWRISILMRPKERKLPMLVMLSFKNLVSDCNQYLNCLRPRLVVAVAIFVANVPLPHWMYKWLYVLI